MKKIFFFLLILTGCISNNRRNQDAGISGKLTVIPLEKEMGHVNLTGLSEVGSSITYIPLETLDLNLLRNLRKIVVKNDLIVVMNETNNVMMFDLSGRFLRPIGRRGGQGPGEYQNMLDFCFSFDGRRIFLLTSHISQEGVKCLEFEVEGTFLNSSIVDSIPVQILPLNEKLFAFHCSNGPAPMNPIGQSLIISDLKSIRKSYKNYHKRYKNPGMSITGSPFYLYQGNLRFKEFGADTLFTVTEDELIPCAIFDLGKKEIPGDLQIISGDVTETYKKYKGCAWILNILEDTTNFYIRMIDDRVHNLYGYFDKQTHTVKVIGELGFQNDLDGGLPFFPKYIYNDSIMVDYVNASELRKHVLNSNIEEMQKKYGKRFDDLLKLVNSLDDISNPVVIMVNSITNVHNDNFKVVLYVDSLDRMNIFPSNPEYQCFLLDKDNKICRPPPFIRKEVVKMLNYI